MPPQVAPGAPRGRAGGAPESPAGFVSIAGVGGGSDGAGAGLGVAEADAGALAGAAGSGGCEQATAPRSKTPSGNRSA
jgi:hypothetical protein